MIDNQSELTAPELDLEVSEHTLASFAKFGRALTLLGKRKTPQERRSECVDLEDEDLKSTLLPVSHRYQFDCPLGMGGMSLVLLARDRLLGRQVAVKILRHDLLDRSAAEKRFFREARIHAQLQHAGIAPLYDMGKFDDGRPCIVMRYLRGKTFDEILQEYHSKTEIPPEAFAQLFDVFAMVCRTMAYAHQKGVIHRDLKPMNVMVTANNQVQVLDWGLSKVVGEEDEQIERSESKISRLGTDLTNGDNPLETCVGAAIGTPAYIAPEQAMGKLSEVDQRSDVFGLGAILCELLTGEPPYTGAFPQVAIAASRGDLSGAMQRLDKCKVPRALIELTKVCLESNPVKRPADASAVVAMLENYRTQMAAQSLQLDQFVMLGMSFRSGKLKLSVFFLALVLSLCWLFFALYGLK